MKKYTVDIDNAISAVNTIKTYDKITGWTKIGVKAFTQGAAAAIEKYAEGTARGASPYPNGLVSSGGVTGALSQLAEMRGAYQAEFEAAMQELRPQRITFEIAVKVCWTKKCKIGTAEETQCKWKIYPVNWDDPNRKDQDSIPAIEQDAVFINDANDAAMEALCPKNSTRRQ